MQKLQLLSKYLSLKALFEGRLLIYTVKVWMEGYVISKVGDEVVHKELGDRMERAVTTASSLEVEQENGSGPRCHDTILGDVGAQTRFETTSGYTLGSGEDSDYWCIKVNVAQLQLNAAKLIGMKLKLMLLQALVDKKKVIIMETSIRSDLHLDDAGGIDCFPTATIFEELARMRRKQRKETKVPQDETHHDDSVPIPSNDPLLSGEDRMQLTELMILCTNLQKQVLDLEKAKDAQAKEIAGLKKRVQKLERKKKSRTTGLKRLRKVGESRRVASSEDKESLGTHEDASKQGRIFEDFDKDAEVSLVDETQGRLDDAEMFDIDDLHGDEVIIDMAVVTTAGKGVTTAIDELTLAQTLIEIKAAKPKAVTTAATTTTTTRPKARGVVVQEPSEFRTTTSSPQASQPSKTKDKGKAIMIEPEVPLKKKDQVALDEEMARNLEAQLQAELIEEEKMARKKEEEANIALIESWENTQAMMEADRLLAERLQTREQEELTDEEKAKLFMET
ncbi:hypothetical protein Tco_0788848 [Tanacetum coccineum]